MADIRLRIEVNENAETETLGKIINKVNSSASVDNIVNTSFHAYPSQIFFFNKGEFILPESQVVSGNNGLAMASDDGSSEYDFIFNDFDELDNVDRLSGLVEDETDPQEFIWGIVPSNKEYTVTLTFSNATSLKDIVILGDTVANQFPTEAIIDGTTTIYSDDPKWVINLGTESSTHTIQFTKWNRANYNACLAWIRVTLKYLDLDKGWIDRFESNAQSTGDASAINYGILANSGSADIRDLDGELQDLIVDGVLPISQVPIEVYVNGNKIQEHITKDADYIKKDKNLSLQTTNIISSWNDIIVPEIKLKENISAYSLLQTILNSVNLSSYFNYLVPSSSAIKTYLESINFGYVEIESESLINVLNYFCEITQNNIYFDNDGSPKFLNARPIVYSDENKIFIPNSYKITNLEDSLILKNKIKTINFDETQFQYSSKNLAALEVDSQTYTVDELTDLIEDSSFWVSDIISDANFLNDNETYVTEEYTDTSNRVWVIAYKKQQYDYYFNVSRYKYINGTLYSINLFPVFREKNTFKMYRDYRLDITSVSSVADIKSLLDGLSNNFKACLNFLQNEYSPVDNNYVKEIQPIFAFRKDATFPIRFFACSDSVDVNGNKITATLQEIRVTNVNEKYTNNNGDLNVSFGKNPLISNFALKNNQKISKVISDNILADYANGVSVAKIDVFCGDLYNSSNTKVKDWSQGEILDVGDVVYFDDDLKADQSQRYWRVTGRKFKYEGAPTLSLELQEIVSIVQNS